MSLSVKYLCNTFSSSSKHKSKMLQKQNAIQSKLYPTYEYKQFV